MLHRLCSSCSISLCCWSCVQQSSTSTKHTAGFTMHGSACVFMCFDNLPVNNIYIYTLISGVVINYCLGEHVPPPRFSSPPSNPFPPLSPSASPIPFPVSPFSSPSPESGLEVLPWKTVVILDCCRWALAHSGMLKMIRKCVCFYFYNVNFMLGC